jgi:multidrug efflux system membrane fusion protein
MRAWMMSLAFASTAVVPQLAGALDLDGRLAWNQRLELGTLVSGVVSEVAVSPGQVVSADTVLLKLDDRGFRAEVSRARATLARSKAQADEAVREDDRARELYDRTMLSDHERQMAEIARVEAESALAEARASLAQASLDLDLSRLRAPFAARILAVNVRPGQAVVSSLQSQPLIVLADSRVMLAVGEIGASQLKGLEVGQAAQVGLGGDWLNGRIQHIGLEPVRQAEREVFYPVQVAFEVPRDGLLRAGMPAVLRLTTP